MIGRAAQAWLMAMIVLLLATIPACAEQWPDHGFFFVRSKTQESIRICELNSMLIVDQGAFALVLSETDSRTGPLIVNYMSDNPHIAQAERVVVAINGVEMLTFRPLHRSSEPEITSLAGPVSGEAATGVWKAIQQAAKKAKWLTVKAGDTTTRVPAKGLRKALADFGECRRQRSLSVSSAR